MPQPPNIILLGFMGSGKSTTGRELSQLTGFQYWDMDQWIEEKNGKSVSEIFETFGESYFRSEEQESMEWIKKRTHYVSSLGGGAWLSENLREVLLALGWCVWLKVSPVQCFQRVGENLSKRPLLAKNQNPLNHITQLLEKRSPLYSLAHFSIETDNKTPKEVATEIYETILKVKPFDLPQMSS